MAKLSHLTTKQKIIIMLAVMGGLFVVALDQTIVATALGAIVQDFNSYSSLGLVVTAYLLTMTITMPIAGKLSDLFGRRKLLLIGLSVFTLGSLLSGLSQSIEQLVAFRALQGIGGGVVMANAFTIVGDLFTPRERGKWQGIIGAVFGLSSVVGPVLGGFLTDGQEFFDLTTDWRWNFYINVPVGIAASIIIAIYSPALKQTRKIVIDYLGTITLTVGLAALIAAVDDTDLLFSWLVNFGVNLDTIRTGLYALAVISLLGFVIAEKRSPEPIIPLSFFKSRSYTSSMSAFIFFGAAFLAVILYVTQFNQQVYGVSATESGLMLLPLILAMSISSGVIGQIVTKTGFYKRFIVSGFLIATIGIFGLTYLHPDSPYWIQAIMTAVAGLGFGVGMPILNLAVQNEFDDSELGAATSSSQLFRGLGSTLGTAALTALLTVGVGTTLGNVSQSAYVMSLQHVPEAQKMLGDGDISTDTALQLNSQRKNIAKQAKLGIKNSPLPKSVQKQQISQFQKNQSEFSRHVTNSFAKSLDKVFVVTSALMAASFVAVLFIKERPLKES